MFCCNLVKGTDRQASSVSCMTRPICPARYPRARRRLLVLHALVAKKNEPEIAVRACLLLAEQYYGQYGCLDEFREHAALPADIRKSVVEMQFKRLQWNKRLKERLQASPLFAFQMATFPDSILGVEEELKMLLDDPDPQLQQLACSALKKHYPDSHAQCTSKK